MQPKTCLNQERCRDQQRMATCVIGHIFGSKYARQVELDKAVTSHTHSKLFFIKKGLRPYNVHYLHTSFALWTMDIFRLAAMDKTI